MNLEGQKLRILRIYDKPISIMVVATLFVVLVCLSLISLDVWRTWQARDIQLHESEIRSSRGRDPQPQAS